MGHISHRGHFDAPPELVFARGTDPEFMPQYWPKMVRIWDVVGRPDEVGSSFRFRERLLGRYYEGRTEVVAVEAPRMQTTLTTYSNGVRVRWEMRITPTDHGIDGADEIDYEVPRGLLFAIADRLVLRRMLENALTHGGEKFKALVEAEAAAVPHA